MMVLYRIHLRLGADIRVREHHLTQVISDIKEWAERGLYDANFNKAHMICGLMRGKIVTNKDFDKTIIVMDYYKSKAFRPDQMFGTVEVDCGGNFKATPAEMHEFEDEDYARFDAAVIREIHKRKEWFMHEARFCMWLEYNLDRLEGCTPIEALEILQEDGWVTL